MRWYRPLAPLLFVAATAGLLLAQSQQPGPPQPARDAPARQGRSDAPAGSISGRVLTADTGRPVVRARVFISASELPQGRAAQTNETGAFEFTDLPAGRYTVTVSKTGFISLSYGQRRPLQAGTPLQLADGQQLKGIDFRLPRGSAIAGRVFDENGEPMAGAVVQVLRYQNAQGTRQLVPAGTAQTDDRGQYRVWGLNPGEYYVSANASGFGGRGPGGRGGPLFFGRGRGGPPGVDSSDADAVGYAPTFFPGVPSVAEARPITVALSGETLDINFNVMLVRTGRVFGSVLNSDGSSTWTGLVNLVPDGQGARLGPGGPNYGSRIGYDGTFSIASVPPGRYTLRARSMMRDEPAEYASLPLTVNGSDVTVNVALAPGATITGTLSIEATQSGELPDLTQFRISLPSVDGMDLGPQAGTRADKEGKFSVDAVPQGSHWIRAQAPRGWMLKSVVYEGRDVVDAPFEVRSGEKISGIRVVFTDRLTEINGAVTNDQGVPVTEYTVLAFPTDFALWRPQSRQIMTTRPDQNGKFQIRGLPPGEYFLAAVDPAQPGEWFDPSFLEQHRAGAARVMLGDGDTKTQDFRIVTR